MIEECKPMKVIKTVFTVSVFCLAIVCHESSAQIHYSSEFHQLSFPEKRWVFFHPFIAKKAFRLTQQAREAAKEMANSSLLDGDENGGQADAFRHAYWMALLSQNINWRKARQLGKAHEKGNYKDFKKRRIEEGALPDSVSGMMDLFNNETGIEIGRKNKDLAKEELIRVVRDSVMTGRMKIIRKGKNGDPIDCEGNKINLQDFEHRWNIPKCLVESDFKYLR